jgi:DNA-binding CsgD family transcriptional regulator
MPWGLERYHQTGQSHFICFCCFTTERTILALVAEGHTHKQAAGHLGLAHRSVTNALGRMRDRYTSPTNEALIALAIRLQWIAVAIEVHPDETSPPRVQEFDNQPLSNRVKIGPSA